MSRAQRPMNKPTAIIISALVGVVTAALFVAFVVHLLNKTGAEGLGRDLFTAGNPVTLAREFATRGPIQFQALQGDKDVYLLHRTGADATAGWWAVQAAPPGRARRCGVRYDLASDRFVDGCDPATTYPLDGTGLLCFPVQVVKGPKLLVDLRGSYPGPAVPSPPTTTTTKSPSR